MSPIAENETPRSMTPREIVGELDKYIVGQHKAKRAVAIALRNRWRRAQVAEPLRQEITPKNIMMIGPTGVGKTEIARRLARLVGAPFIKVEATRFTEVGYVGRDVETIIRDLAEIAVKDAREAAMQSVRQQAEEAAFERVLDVLVPPSRNPGFFADANDPNEDNSTRTKFRKKLQNGELDQREIDIEVQAQSMQAEIFAPPGMEELTNQIQGMFQNLGNGRKKHRKLPVSEALKILAEEEASKLVNDDDIKTAAVRNVEQNGIVFLDEIDKIASRSDGQNIDVSRQGVQRDLLPLVEGATVSTKFGMIRTDHILFIASGAFHLAKPSDLIPELQGRFPIRVELESLSVADFERILTATDACLTKQYQALLATEAVELCFSESGVKRLASTAFSVNEKTENIGARRLYTVMEKLLEEPLFRAGDGGDSHLLVDADYVDAHLGELAQNEDLSRYVL